MAHAIDFGEYFDYQTLCRHLQGLAADYPALAQLEVIGQRWRGRDIHCVTLTNADTGAHDSKPAFYIDAGIHAEEVATTQTAVYHHLAFADELWQRRRCHLAAGQPGVLHHPAHQPRRRGNQPEDSPSLVRQRTLAARRGTNAWICASAI